MLRRLSVAAFASFIVAAVASCGGILPNSAVPGHVARGYYPVDDTTPLIALIRERGIEAPSHSSPTPILDQLAAELAKTKLGGFIEVFDLDRYNANATIAENLVFGAMRNIRTLSGVFGLGFLVNHVFHRAPRDAK